MWLPCREYRYLPIKKSNRSCHVHQAWPAVSKFRGYIKMYCKVFERQAFLRPRSVSVSPLSSPKFDENRSIERIQEKRRIQRIQPVGLQSNDIILDNGVSTYARYVTPSRHGTGGRVSKKHNGTTTDLAT
ncbi:unnamed protein product [Ectocarpus sp. 4 AP-2014]